jgi:hypothetical protein
MHCDGHFKAQALQKVHFSISFNSAPRAFSNGGRTSRGYRRVAFGKNKFRSTFGVILNMLPFPAS